MKKNITHINNKRSMFFTIILIVIVPLYASNDTITSSLYEVEIKDIAIYSLLDKAIIHEAKNKKYNNTFKIRIDKENNQIELCIAYLDNDDKKIYDKGYYGYLIFKNNLFFISGYDKLNNHRFFKRTKNKRNFSFIIPEGLYVGIEETGWFYYYQNGQYILNYLFHSNE